MVSVVLANHLGLIEAIEGVIKRQLPIINCPKCCTFWSVLLYAIIAKVPPIASVTIAFVMSLMSVWTELLFGYIDTLYTRLYEKIYPTKDNNATDTQTITADCTEKEMPEV